MGISLEAVEASEPMKHDLRGSLRNEPILERSVEEMMTERLGGREEDAL